MSPYEALVLFVHKKDSTLQMCILYINSLVCLWHDNSAAKAFYGRTGLCIFYGRTGLCIILALRVVVAERHTPAIDRVVTTVY